VNHISIKKTSLYLNIARVLIIAFVVIAAVWYFASGHRFSVSAVLSYTPQNWFLATLFMLLLYAVKSVVFFLPLMVLQIAAGLYFPTWAAILVNLIGMIIELNIPYWLGRKLGFNTADKLFVKYPKVQAIIEGKQNRWFVAYILRAVNMLPIDLVSMYLGSARFPYFVYFTGSLTGALFGILAATFIGMALTDPTSPAFLASCALSITLSVCSFIIYNRITKKAKI
jgi:uncharacterized membrane protein YdjX (TVP38/TMEM64 family)